MKLLSDEILLLEQINRHPDAQFVAVLRQMWVVWLVVHTYVPTYLLTCLRASWATIYQTT